MDGCENCSVKDYDALVIGGGPGGASAAYWLACAGWHVGVIEKKVFPREKTCGDGLTPRAVFELTQMGAIDEIRPFHRYDGLRANAHGRTLEMPWPSHPQFPSHGYVVRRRDLDEIVLNHAAKAGATILTGHTAGALTFERGRVTGVEVTAKDGVTSVLQTKYLVVADGANSRTIRNLNATRDRSYPMGMAIRGYFTSDRSTDPWIESHLDLRDRQGKSIPGYGWVFPLGDGTVNVGAGLLDTFTGWSDMNTSHLMTEFVHMLPEHWGIRPEHAIGAPTGGRLPTGLSIRPNTGPNWVLCGDAAGLVNPFNGEGISYAYQSGRMAAHAVGLAIAAGDDHALTAYHDALESEFGLYYKTARLFVKAIGRPAVMRECTRVGMRSKTLMEWLLRIMANLLREDERGTAERAYAMAAAIVART